MKADSNTEMDSLLRRHARRRRGVALGGASAASTHDAETPAGESHLDADELNAYAEGELPPGARARYISHLADCDECRGIVAELTLAANVPLEGRERVAQQTTTPKSSWREWLAALFAPPMMRYGATALALLCVVGVVFLVLRQQGARRQTEEPTLVAQNGERAGAANTSAVKPEAVKPESAVNLGEAGQPPVSQVSPTASDAQSGPDQASRMAQPPPKPADVETEAKTRRTNEPTDEGAAMADAPLSAAAPLPSNEPSQRQAAARDVRSKEDSLAKREPAPAPPPATMSPSGSLGRAQERGAETDRLSENRKDGTLSDDRQAEGNTARNTAGAREAEEVVTTTKSAPRPEARRRAMRSRAEAGSSGADSSATGGSAAGRVEETRSVGGRQFRRQGGAWVDKAYSQGRATVNVARGSEQYRALVADEPPLRAIAEQLGGVVIVVWKGRAYRIH